MSSKDGMQTMLKYLMLDHSLNGNEEKKRSLKDRAQKNKSKRLTPFLICSLRGTFSSTVTQGFFVTAP